MEHESYMKQIEAYLAGDLSKEDERALLEHVETCAECKAALGDAKNFEAMLGRVLAASVHDLKKPDLSQITEILAPSALASADRASRRPQYNRFRNVGFLATVAAVFMLAACLLLYTDFSRSHNDKLIQRAHSDIQTLTQILEQTKCGSTFSFIELFSKRTDIPHLDPWGNPYRVITDASGTRIYSFGPNGIDENRREDDITLSK